MRTETEMIDLIFQTAKALKVNAVAMSGSRTNPNAPRDEFQDYDVVYIVEDLDGLLADLTWLERFGKRMIEQHNVLDHRHLYLMLFEDGNRIDLTLCPKEHIREWVDSEAGFTVLEDPKGLFEPYSPSPQRYWASSASAIEFDKACNEFWWVSAYVVGKDYKYLFNYLPAEKEKEFIALLDFSDQKSLTKSLLATMNFFHKEAQAFSLKTGLHYDKVTAEKMIQYAKERLETNETFTK